MESKIIAVSSMSENQIFVIPFNEYYINIIKQGFEIYKNMKENNTLQCKPILIFPDIRGIKLYEIKQECVEKINAKKINFSEDNIENLFFHEGNELSVTSLNSYLVKTVNFYDNKASLYENLNIIYFHRCEFVDFYFEDETLHIKSKNLLKDIEHLSEALYSEIFTS